MQRTGSAIRGLVGVFLIVASFVFLYSNISFPAQWANTYGGGGYEEFRTIDKTHDGGFIVAGSTNSFSGYDDLWVLKLDANGNIVWQKTYGGVGGTKGAYCIRQTFDGGYIVAGYLDAAGTGGRDAWILKLNSDGEVDWQKAYGGPSDDYALSIQQTLDGGYIVAGMTLSYGAGEVDGWVFKLNSSGDIIWQKTYGGTGDDRSHSIQQTSDGGYIVAGRTTSSGAGNADAWVFKLSSSGDVQWEKTYGGADEDRAYDIQQTSDGGYIVTGYTASFAVGEADAWVLKLNAEGNIIWQYAYGGTGWDTGDSIRQTSDGGYILVGETSFGVGGQDVLLLKLDGDGTVAWQRTYGGSSYEEAYEIVENSDGGFTLVGRGDSFGTGGGDALVLRVNRTGSIKGCKSMETPSVTVTPTVAIVGEGGFKGKDSTTSSQNTNVTVAKTYVTPNGVCFYIYIPWVGPVLLPFHVTVLGDPADALIFHRFTDIFSGTMELYRDEEGWVQNEEGCYAKFSREDGQGNFCMNEIASMETHVSKSKTDQFLMIGEGDFSISVKETKYEGIAYSDVKGTLKKDSTGNVTSMSLSGTIAGGADEEMMLNGTFKATLTSETK
jgi:uncharacterized delta-60 repeat protein